MCMKKQTRNENNNLKRINKITKTRFSLKKTFHSDSGFILSVKCEMLTNLRQQWCNETLSFLVFCRSININVKKRISKA